MDADAVPLRDVRELRESGFSNIVGNEDTGEFELLVTTALDFAFSLSL